MIEIKWTKEAQLSFDEVFEFLLNQWNIKIAKRFVLLVNEKVVDIVAFPNQYLMHDNNENIRKVIVHPHITLFYRNLDNENIIEILLFWDNRQNPKHLPL
jgi:plasmid stabilization system protein ParE